MGRSGGVASPLLLSHGVKALGADVQKVRRWSLCRAVEVRHARLTLILYKQVVPMENPRECPG
jgi:hypothetical protein